METSTANSERKRRETRDIFETSSSRRYATRRYIPFTGLGNCFFMVMVATSPGFVMMTRSALPRARITNVAVDPSLPT